MELFDRIRRLLTVPTDDVELVRAQFRAFVKQIPLLYFILSVNTMAVVFTFAKFGHPWITIYAPSLLCLICCARAIMWSRMNGRDVSDAMAIRHMQRTNRLAFLLAVGFTAWGLTLFGYGDAYAQSQVVFFLALTMISCIFCLVHLRPAVLNVTFVGVAPFSVFFFFAEQGHFRAAAINLALVTVGMVAILMIYYRDFARLVASRKALFIQQAETQLLSDENLKLANLDSLSGLPNRRALITKLSRLQADAPHSGATTAVAFIDLDGFKDVNDTYGHETGDKLIRIVSKFFEALVPKGGMLARLGGDEFALVISACDSEALARLFAFDVIDRLRHPIRIGERTITVGASIGISSAPPRDCDAQELFRRADIAMYHVKANGKSGVTAYSSELDAERQRQQDIEAQIREGLRRGDFEVFYQPIVDAATKAIVSVEALLRWPRRLELALGPDIFIPIAESSGLIHTLGLFVLRKACADMNGIVDIGLSVNVSPAQFRDPEFEAKVAAILEETGFPARRLELEITEGYLIDHPDRADAAIASLKAMGVSVALDDFGIGYSSIAYLQRYGFNRIKIDKSLTAKITKDNRASVLITGAVYMANGLDMAVTAEGVETEEQEQLLRLAGCRCLQGFRFCMPKPLPDLLANELSTLRRAI